MNRITTGIIVSLLIVIAALAWATDHYHGNAVRFRLQRDTATHNLKLANEAISDMQTRQRDVAAGRRRLLVNATCPAMPTGKSTATASMDDAPTARLTDAAEQDYFTLRARIETVTKQLTGLQAYMRNQCLN